MGSNEYDYLFDMGYTRKDRMMNGMFSKSSKQFADRFDAALQQFVIEKGVTDPKEVERWRRTLVDAFVNDNWYPDEYFFFNYERLSNKGIHEFVANREANLFWNFW